MTDVTINYSGLELFCQGYIKESAFGDEFVLEQVYHKLPFGLDENNNPKMQLIEVTHIFRRLGLFSDIDFEANNHWEPEQSPEE